jgi:hypothetical protein
MKVANDLMNFLRVLRYDPKAVEHFQKVYNMRDGNFVFAFLLVTARNVSIQSKRIYYGA